MTPALLRPMNCSSAKEEIMLYVFTYYTNTTKASNLLESAALHGLSIHNLAITTEWCGLQDKLIAMKEKIFSLQDDDVCCFVDAYDVIVNTNEARLLALFEHSGADILFGAETQLDPPIIPRSEYPESESPFRFLNSGVYIGRVAALKKMLNWGDFLGLNDQEYANRYFLAKRLEDNLKLDGYCLLALNMWTVPWDRLEFRDGYINFLEIDVTPCFVHFNGLSFLDLVRDFESHEGGRRWKPNPQDHTTLRDCVVLKTKTAQENGLVEYLQGHGHTYNYT